MPRAATPALGSRLGALVGLAVALACDPSPPSDPDPTPRPPDVLMIVVDTLRWDALGSYGGAPDTTPALDTFAGGAIRFDRAYATAPWTQPSVASILTGALPSRHGLTSIGVLPESLVTLPERLEAADYARVGIVSHVLLARRHGFDQGFDRFIVAAALPAHWALSTETVTEQAEIVLAATAASPENRRPVFLFVHYFDPHYVYHAHPDYGWSAAENAGRLEGSESIESLRAMSDDLTEEERDFIRALYREEVRHTDAGIGRLLGKLEALGLADETLVIITADHGEELLERGWLGHTRTLYDEVVRVPLIVRPPGYDGDARVHPEVVSLTRLAPTVLDYAGLRASNAARDQRSLRPLLDAPSPPVPRADEPVVIEVDFVGADARNAAKDTHQKAIVMGGLKLVRDDVSGRVSLYDLLADPGETRDLSGDRPAQVASMIREMDERLAVARSGRHEVPALPTDRETREQLRALGYLEGDPPDGGAPAPAPDRERRP